MNVPYNTGKVKIGSKYDMNPLKPKYIEEDIDMLEIQSYLIYDPRVINKQYWTTRIYATITMAVFLILILSI
jgi:hypothetical protein